MGLIDALKSKEDIIYGKGASISEIKYAEQKLKLQFATDYRNYLSEFSSVMYDGHELTGLMDVKRLNVIDVTLNHINERDSNDKYVIEEIGVDGIVVWQNTKGEVFWGNEIICKNLMEYISE